jgi:hypothetical protein
MKRLGFLIMLILIGIMLWAQDSQTDQNSVWNDLTENQKTVLMMGFFTGITFASKLLTLQGVTAEKLKDLFEIILKKTPDTHSIQSVVKLIDAYYSIPKNYDSSQFTAISWAISQLGN